MAPVELRREIPDGLFFTDEGGTLQVFAQLSMAGEGRAHTPDVVREKLDGLLEDGIITDVLVRGDSEKTSAICWAEAPSNRINRNRLKMAGAVAV